MPTNPTTDPVTAAVDSLRRADDCRCPKCEEGRNADAAQITAELTQLRADLATLVPLAKSWIAPDSEVSMAEYDAARAVLAKLDAEVPRG